MHYPVVADPAPPSSRGPVVSWSRRLAVVLLCAALAACSAGPRAPRVSAQPPAPPPATQANDVLMRAIGLVGTPYRYGGNTPEGGFDCSGLIGFVFRDAAGLELPRTTRQLAAMERPLVPRRQLHPGDLVFFGPRGSVNHAGIYVGDGRFVHAPSTGGTVRLDALDGPYWRDTYLQARRVLR